MPKIDPITGCEVMTREEFLLAESQRSGQEIWEIMDDIYRQLDADAKENVDKVREDPMAFIEAAIEFEYGDHPEDAEWRPVKGGIKEVIETSGRCTMNDSHTFMVCTLECDDGVTRKVQVDEWWYGGSFYEPPEEGFEIKEITDEQDEALD